MEELLSFLPTSRSLSSGECSFYFTTDEGMLFHRACKDSDALRIDLPWPIRAVSTYHDTTAVITYSGEVYTWKAHSAVTPDARLLKLPSAVMSVRVGLTRILAVTIDGNLYTEDELSATLIGLPFTCQEIVGYFTEIRMLATDGSLYELDYVTNTPTKVILDESASMVAMGRFHTLILSVTGKVLSYGSNEEGQLGIGDGVENVTVPVHIQLPAKCRVIACGSYHSLAVLETGEIYGWGDTLEGELGVDNIKLYWPTLVDTRPDIVMIGAGVYHTVMIGKDDQVYIIGEFNEC